MQEGKTNGSEKWEVGRRKTEGLRIGWLMPLRSGRQGCPLRDEGVEVEEEAMNEQLPLGRTARDCVLGIRTRLQLR